MGIWESTFFTRTAFAYFYSDFTDKNNKKWFKKGEIYTETAYRSMEAVSTMKLPLKKTRDLHNTETCNFQFTESKKTALSTNRVTVNLDFGEVNMKIEEYGRGKEKTIVMLHG